MADAQQLFDTPFFMRLVAGDDLVEYADVAPRQLTANQLDAIERAG